MSDRIRPLLLISTLVIGLLVACGDDAGDQTAGARAGSSFPLTIVQSDGAALTIAAAPQRVVSLSAHATEVFCALDAGPQLVAVERYANCPLGSSAKPVLDAFTPSLETIVSFEPDLVYVADDSGILEALRRLDVPVLYIELPTTLEGVLDHVLTLGRAAGRETEAKALAHTMQERIDAVTLALADVERGPRVYHELTTDYFSAAPSSFIGDVYTLLKAQNIAAGANSAYPQLSAEVIIERDPEVIVLADEASGVTADSVRARPGWSVIEAVAADRICVIDPDIVSRPGPRIVDAIDALAECIYPDRFS